MNPPTWLLVLVGSSLVFLMVAWSVTAFFRLSAAWRHLVWLLALVLPVLVLIIVPAGLRVKLPVLKPAQPLHVSVSDLPSFEVIVPSTKALPAPNMAQVSAPAPALSPESLLVVLWGLGCLTVMGALALSHLNIRRKLTRLRGAPASSQLQSAFALASRQADVRAAIVIADFTEVPFCYGVFRPCVVFPRSANEWGHEMINACLAHEFAHLRRRDLLTLAIAQLGCAMVWFNPLVWYGLGRLRASAESAADDLAIEQSTVRQTYASQLIAVASLAKGIRFTATTFPMARVGPLRQRIDSLLDDTRRRRAPGIWRTFSLVVALSTFFTVCLTVELVAAVPEGSLETGKEVNETINVLPIMVASDGDFRDENGTVFAKGNVRLQWRGLRAQADAFQYDRSKGTIWLVSQTDLSEPRVFFMLTLKDDTKTFPRVEKQSDIPLMNPAKSSISGPVVIVADDNTTVENGAAVATKNAMLSQDDVIVGADRVEYIAKDHLARFYEKVPDGGYHQLAAATMSQIKQSVYDFAKEYLTAQKAGDEVKLRGLLGVELIPNLSDTRRREVEDSWIHTILEDRSSVGLSQSLDSYRIEIIPWELSVIKMEPPLYWPITPTYQVLFLAKGTGVALAVHERSDGSLAVVRPITIENSPADRTRAK